MLKTYLSCFIAGLLLVGPTAQLVSAGQQKEKQETTVETTKAKISKLGVGEKAKATIIQKNGARTKGYIARVGDDDFVMRDRKTDNATTIRYADVSEVESNRGHSTAKHVGIGVGIGVGAFLAAILIIINKLD